MHTSVHLPEMFKAPGNRFEVSDGTVIIPLKFLVELGVLGGLDGGLKKGGVIEEGANFGV